jgi:cob(I)alamin adenosyltransferase
MKELATPLREQGQLLTDQIKRLEERIEKLSQQYPEIVTLRTVRG